MNLESIFEEWSGRFTFGESLCSTSSNSGGYDTELDIDTGRSLFLSQMAVLQFDNLTAILGTSVRNAKFISSDRNRLFK